MIGRTVRSVPLAIGLAACCMSVAAQSLAPAAMPTPAPTTARRTTPLPRPTPVPLYIGAAPTTADAVRQLGALHITIGSMLRPPIDVDLNVTVASSGVLRQQVANGAPYDLVVTADRDTMDALIKEGLVDAKTAAPLATVPVVLWIVLSTNADITSLEGLADPPWANRRIAIPNPELAPVGRAARIAMEKLHIDKIVEPRLVIAPDAGVALQYANTRNVEAAFLPRNLVPQFHNGRVIEVPATLHPPLVSWMAVVANAANADEARRFQATVTTQPVVGSILKGQGLDMPTPAPTPTPVMAF